MSCQPSFRSEVFGGMLHIVTDLQDVDNHCLSGRPPLRRKLLFISLVK